MRVSFSLMAAGAVLMMLAALLGYSGKGDSVEITGTCLLIVVLAGMVFFAGWWAQLRSIIRRGQQRQQKQPEETTSDES